jgi:hypothetical protein
MLRFMPVTIRLSLISCFMFMLSACAVTTRSTEGTSETIQNTTDASTDFTSSTSPRDKADNEGRSIKQFASVNLDRLKEDIARGNGEHLTAFAYLLGIKEIHQNEFFTFTKHNYRTLFGPESTTSEDMLARLDTELAAYPNWRQ